MHDSVISAANSINDLFRNHILDNPLCDLCGVVEDTNHYFFHCIKFTVQRQVFNDMYNFQPLCINLFLFGNENWNIEANLVLSELSVGIYTF